MAVQNDNTVVTKGDLKNLYADKIAPYLGANMQLSVGAGDYYSTDEKIVGVWLGKPLYQKIYTTTSPNVNVGVVIEGLSYIDTMVEISGGYDYGGLIPFGWLYDTNRLTSIWFDKSSNSIYMQQTSTYEKNKSVHIIIRYTKTTDTANSAATTVGCYDINRPDQWLENTEIYFGNGLYGKRFTGTITQSANGFSMLILDSSGVTKLINCGGSWYHGSEYICLNGTNDIYQSSALVLSNDVLSLRTKSNQARTNAPYDIWATYTK